MWQIYASEVADILVRLNRNRIELERAVELAYKAAVVALENARPDYLRRMTLLAQAEAALDRLRTPEELPSWNLEFLIARTRTRMHFESAVSLARDPGEPVAHPSHRIGAVIEAAKFFWQIGGDDNDVLDLLDEAEAMAKAATPPLVRQLEKIAKLRHQGAGVVGE